MNNKFGVANDLWSGLRPTNNFIKLGVEFQYQKNVKKLSYKDLGIWSKSKLAKMGPAYIKIGQFMSSRSDIFGEEYVSGLRDLQDKVAPMKDEDFKKIIINSNFKINPIPIASASIGQVHLLNIDDTEQQYVIKIKRYGIEEDVNNDFTIFLNIIRLFKLFIKDRKLTELQILFTEYYNLLKEEIDFIREIGTMKRFKEQFKEYKYIKIPTVYEDISTNDYIVMEYVPGIKIDNIELLSKEYNTAKIATKLIECYLIQIIINRLAHVDCHAGNLAISLDGKIVFYDYGMFLDLGTADNLKQLLLAIYSKNVDLICKLCIDMGFVTVTPKNECYLKSFIINFLNYVENLDMQDFKVGFIEKIKPSAMPFLISSKLLVLLRGLGLLEGICKKLDPDFNYKKILDPYISEYLIDVNYIEDRVWQDIGTISKMPNLMRNTQIELALLENIVYELERDINLESNKRYFAFVGVFISLLTQIEFQRGTEHVIVFIILYGLLFIKEN